MSGKDNSRAWDDFCGIDVDSWLAHGLASQHLPQGVVVLLRRLVQLTAARNNQQETLDAEKATCNQHRAAIAELAEDALAAKVDPCSPVL